MSLVMEQDGRFMINFSLQFLYLQTAEIMREFMLLVFLYNSLFKCVVSICHIPGSARMHSVLV